MTIADLFARIGVKADTGKVKQFQGAMNSAKQVIVTTTGDIVKFVLEVRKMTQELFDSAAAFKQFEAETGASAVELQKWQAVAEQTNNSAESVSTAIKSIVSNQEKIRLGQGNISGYQLLGIDPRQDPFKILEELREKTTGLSQGMKKTILGQMGIGSELIQVLDLTNDRFRELSENAFIIPQRSIDAMDKARASMAGVSRAVKFLKSLIAAELSPGIQEMNEQIVEWIKNNKEGIIRTVKTAFEWIKKFTEAVFNAGRMINTVVENTIGWENAIKGLLAILAILNAGIIASPIGLLIAGLLLLIGVLDDLYVYSKGGKSLFGVLMDKFPNFEKKFKSFAETMENVLGLMKALFKGDHITVEKYLEEMGALGDAIVLFYDSISAAFGIFSLSVSNIFKSFKWILDIINDVSGVLSGEKDFGETIKQLGKDYWKSWIVDPFTEFGAGVKGFFTGDKNGNRGDININMEVNTTADAEETANIVQSEIVRKLKEAEAQLLRSQ